MSEAITVFIYYGVSWLLSIGALIWFLNWRTRGFIIKYFRSIAARGKLVLIRSEDVVGKYWTHGGLTKDHTFEWKARSGGYKQSTDLDAIKRGFYDFMGVKCIDINENKDLVKIYTSDEQIDYEPLCTSETADAMLKLHATKPNLGIDKNIILIILVIIAIIAAGAAAFMAYNNSQVLQLVLAAQKNASQVIIGGY